MAGFTRRQILKVSGLAAATGWLGAAMPSLGVLDEPRASARRRVLRFAHLTDIHVQPEKNAAKGLETCLRHVGALEGGTGKPDLIVTGGDLIMDGFEASQARTQTQWDLFTKGFADHAPAPVEHTLGNHDIWGWNKTKSKTTGDEPGWGKQWAMDLLGLQRPYRAFDRGGWRFVILDSVRPEGNGYAAYLDEAQMDWLARELASVGRAKPIVVVSHIPIFAACSSLGGDEAKPAHAGASIMHTDARRLHKLFVTHGVRLAISGHIHRLDRTDYQGVAYICDGAVSGSWWNGPKDRCDEGFGVFDLYDDGTFDHRYVAYGWKTE